MSDDPPPGAPSGSPPGSPLALALAELMCARLCHDLSGAVGLVASLLDLAASAAKEADEALAEARQTASDLAARLIVLRAAWTPAGEDDVPVARLHATAAPFLRQRRVEIDLSGLDGADPLPAAAGRVALNVLLLCAEALPRGGTVAVASGGDGALLFTLAGANAAWPAGLAVALGDARAALGAVDDPRHLQGPLAMAVAEQAGYRPALLHDAGSGRGGPPPLLLDRAPRRYANGA